MCQQWRRRRATRRRWQDVLWHLGVDVANTPFSHCQTALCAAQITAIVPAGLLFPPGATKHRREDAASRRNKQINTIRIYSLLLALIWALRERIDADKLHFSDARRRLAGSFFTPANNPPMKWKGSRDVCVRRGSWRGLRGPLSVI